MNYGLYLSASGVLTNMYRQDVFANNLANASTVGFKRDLAAISQRDPESIEGGHAMQWRNDLLDELGGGVFAVLLGSTGGLTYSGSIFPVSTRRKSTICFVCSGVRLFPSWDSAICRTASSSDATPPSW